MKNITKEQIQFQSPSSITVTDREGPETFPAHWHDAAEFTLILKDGCKYKINDILYEAQKGDVLLVWPHQIHETILIPRDSAIFIQFPSTILEHNLDLVSISRFLYKLHFISSSKEKELTNFISDKIWEIKKIYISSDSLSETKCKLDIYNILIKLSEYVLNKNTKEQNNTNDIGWKYIHSACRFIVENSSENINQTQVSKYIGLSTFYFSKLFKKYMNMSFPTYLSNLRVKNAASLLLNNQLSITECAYKAGFGSTTSFNKAFHEITGYSPRDFRQLYRK